MPTSLILAALMGAQAATDPAPQATPPASGATTGTPAAGAAAIAVGAAVNDLQGQPVGTISQLTADAVVIDTGTVKAGVPRAAVGPAPNGGLQTTVTKATLEAAASQGAAQLQSLLTPGTPVHASDGSTVLGTVKAADPKLVTVNTPKGDIRLPANAFAARPSGLVVSLTADQFNAAVTQSLAAGGGPK